jgi:hypothetical protein
VSGPTSEQRAYHGHWLSEWRAVLRKKSGHKFAGGCFGKRCALLSRRKGWFDRKQIILAALRVLVEKRLPSYISRLAILDHSSGYSSER